VGGSPLTHPQFTGNVDILVVDLVSLSLEEWNVTPARCFAGEKEVLKALEWDLNLVTPVLVLEVLLQAKAGGPYQAALDLVYKHSVFGTQSHFDPDVIAAAVLLKVGGCPQAAIVQEWLKADAVWGAEVERCSALLLCSKETGESVGVALVSEEGLTHMLPAP
jgi:hypothetical protein